MNYKRLYDALCLRGMIERSLPYQERHHIIPRCMGGTDNADNLTALTPREHFVAHWLLWHIARVEKNIAAEHRLSHAFWKMAHIDGGGIRVTSKVFERLMISRREALKALWSTDEFRLKRKESADRYNATSEAFQKRSAASRKALASPEAKSKMAAKMAARWQCPEYRQEQSDRMKALMADGAQRERRRETSRASALRPEIRKAASIRLLALNLSPEFRAAQQAAHAQRYAGFRITKPCAHCGAEFESLVSVEQLFCSAECGYASRRRLDARSCIYCGSEFHVKPNRVTKYCSKSCAARHRCAIRAKQA